jgi:hypothetical protein
LAGAGLGWAEGELASDLKKLLGHGDPAVQQIDPADTKPGQLAPAQAGVGSDQDQRSEPPWDGVG